MGRTSLSKEIRDAVYKNDNNMCANCGSTEFLEIHHVVPVEVGGTDKLTNLKLLCQKCHVLAHASLNGLKLGEKKKRGGRKQKPRIQNWEEAIIAFVHGEMGNKTFRVLMNVGKNTKIKDPHCKWFREVLDKAGIANYENYIDYARCSKGKGIHDGDIASHVEYADGTKKNFFYSKELEDKWVKLANDFATDRNAVEVANARFKNKLALV